MLGPATNYQCHCCAVHDVVVDAECKGDDVWFDDVCLGGKDLDHGAVGWAFAERVLVCLESVGDGPFGKVADSEW